MGSFIVKTDDTVIFLPAFPPAVVIVNPGKIKGSGPTKINEKAVCVLGDEGKVKVKNCQYTAGPFSIPGFGTLKIASLESAHKAKKTTSGTKKVILDGNKAMFKAKFKVKTPAQMPPSPPAIPKPVDDTNKEYGNGKGMFVTSNLKVTGS